MRHNTSTTEQLARLYRQKLRVHSSSLTVQTEQSSNVIAFTALDREYTAAVSHSQHRLNRAADRSRSPPSVERTHMCLACTPQTQQNSRLLTFTTPSREEKAAVLLAPRKLNRTAGRSRSPPIANITQLLLRVHTAFTTKHAFGVI